jgi:hypothetical protein
MVFTPPSVPPFPGDRNLKMGGVQTAERKQIVLPLPSERVGMRLFNIHVGFCRNVLIRYIQREESRMRFLLF